MEQVVVLNTQTGPAADVEVRQMLQLATDRGAINDQLYDGFFDWPRRPSRPGRVWHTDPGWPDADLDEARAQVEEWEADNGPIEIKLNVVAAQDNLELAQALAAQWDEAGITTEIESVDQGRLAQLLPIGDYEAVLIPFFPGSDPDEHYAFMDPNEENIGGPGELSINFARYTSPEMSDVLHGARQTDDQAERVELYGQLWKDSPRRCPTSGSSTSPRCWWPATR